MAGLSLAGVGKRFGDVVALAPLDLDVEQGELMALVGPSGSGKTTALRIVAGLEEPTAGRVELAGRDVTREPPGRRNVAMVFQHFALFPHLTAEENIGFGLRARGVRGAEARTRVVRAADAVGCAELLERKPHELSGGERQRVALARALLREPDVFLLDEPLSSLDAQLRVQMRAELKALQRRLGATMLYVTHDQAEALTLGDRVAVLDRGRLQQVATPDDLYARPANRFVGGFIGSPPMNFVEDGDELRGVRPEQVALTPGGDVRVELVEVAGPEAIVHLSDGLVARVDAVRRPQVGDSVAVEIAPEAVHRFDPVTGERRT